MQRYGIALFTPTIRDMMEIAQLADEAGFDSLWNGEFFNRNGLVTLAAVATCTQRAKIATGIAYAYMRNPVLNATGAMDIDELSNGPSDSWLREWDPLHERNVVRRKV